MKFLNWVYVVTIFLLSFIFFSFDSESLNFLFTSNEELVVSDVSYLSVDYDIVISKDSERSSQLVVAQSNSLGTIAVLNKVAFNDYWKWPTEDDYTITTYFSGSHPAIDIYSGYGSSIYAANNGEVSMVMGGCSAGNLSCNGGGGNYIVLNHHNGYYTVYMHLVQIDVSVGDIVSRGQVIGKMGNTGNVIPAPYANSPYLGTHLHFCLYKGIPFHGGVSIDPLSLY